MPARCQMRSAVVPFAALSMFWPGLAAGQIPSRAPSDVPVRRMAPAPSAPAIRPLLCPESEAELARDPWLRRAMAVAYPEASTQEDRCVFPYAALLFDSELVLLTLAGTPGGACHSCPAVVSAVVFRRAADTIQVASKQDDFADIGTWGNVLSVHPTTFGRHSAFTLESGYVFQGYVTGQVHAYIVRNERVEDITPQSAYRHVRRLR